MMFLPQHDAHVVDRKYQDVAAFGREQAEQTVRDVEEQFAPARANVAAMRKIAPQAFCGTAAERRKPHLFIVR